MKTNIPVELKAILKPILFLVVLIILSVIVIKEGFARISTLKDQLSTAKKDEAILSEKESFLREVSPDISTNADLSVAAIPAKNSTLIALSQLKSFSSTNNVSLSNIKVGVESKEEDLSSTQIRFDAEGNLSSVLAFIKGLSNLLPISIVEKVKLASQGETSRASVSIKVFFSPYPTKLTSLTEPIEDLSADEKSILSKLNQSIMPSFVEVQPLGPSGRIVPFEQ
jgi:hypothetical protein